MGEIIINKNRYNGIDLMKFIMAIFVVAIHTKPFISFNSEFVSRLFDLITGVAVPFFFIASGFLLASKFSEPFYCEQNLNKVKKQLKRIVKMYLIWELIYLPLAIYNSYQHGDSILFGAVSILRKVVLRGQNYNSWQLWYLLSTVYALAFMLFLMKTKRGTKTLYILAAASVILSKLINMIAWSENAMPHMLEPVKKIIEYTITDGSLLSGFFFLPLGIFIYRNQNITKYFRWLFIPGIVLSVFIDNETVNAILSYVIQIGVFSFALNLRLNDRKIYYYFRRISIAVYLIHMYINTFVCYALYREMKDGMLSFVLTALISILLSVIYVYFSEQKSKTEMR